MIEKGDRVMSLKDGSTGYVILHDKSIEFYRVKMDYKTNENYMYDYRWFIPQDLVKI